MDACNGPDSVTQDFHCKSCVYCFSLNSKLPHVGTKDSLLKDVGIQSIADVHGHADDTSKIGNLANLFEATLQVHDVNSTASEKLKNLHLNLDQNDMHFIQDAECKVMNVCKLDACSIPSKKTSERSDAFPCKQEVIIPSQSVDIIEDALRMTSESDEYSEQAHKSNVSLTAVSLNTSQKLVSAMKGSREQQGLAPKAKMNVKWAPGVYDPPVSLVSHTVRSSTRRPKAKKDKYKQKHKGGKASRGNYTGRKQSNRNIVIHDDLRLRLQGPAESLLLSAPSSSTTKLVEFALNSNESKCGSGFLMNPLTKVQLPVGKAS